MKPQHLTAIKALQNMSNSKSSEIQLGTTELWFQPGKIKGGDYTIDIITAGSITLLLQSLLMPILFASSKINLTIKGGTCGKWQASVDYLQHLLLPQLKRFVKDINIRIVKRGYYPKGGGEVEIQISPKIKLDRFNDIEKFLSELTKQIEKIELIEQNKLEQIRGIVNLSEELTNKQIDERIINSAKNLLTDKKIPINISSETRKTLSIGGELLLWSIHSNYKGEVDQINPVRLSGDALIENNKSPEQVAKEAVIEILEEINKDSAVDKHLTDQILQFMVLLPSSKIKTSEITKHTKTNIYVLEKFFEVKFIEKNKEIEVVEN